MMLVLLNDVNDLHMPHLFFSHACNDRVVTIFKNWQTLFRDKTSDQEQSLSASVWKRRRRKMHKRWNTVLKMKEQSSSGMVMRAESVK